MRVFIAVLVLIFSLQSWTKAEGIRDFEIEGMSIGDSLLDYFNEDEIKNGIQYDYYNDDLYYESQIDNKNFGNYDGVSITFFSGDNNYIIQGMSGYKFMDSKKCLVERNEIKKVMDEIWPNASSDKYTNIHSADKSGNSKYHHILYVLRDGKKVIGNAIIECLDWSSEITNTKGWTDNLNLRITTDELEIWIATEAYN